MANTNRSKKRYIEVTVTEAAFFDNWFQYIHDDYTEKEIYDLIVDILETGCCDEVEIVQKLLKRFPKDEV